jgi:hypothetical protein
MFFRFAVGTRRRGRPFSLIGMLLTILAIGIGLGGGFHSRRVVVPEVVFGTAAPLASRRFHQINVNGLAVSGRPE